jgi:hypothetical protein
MCPADFSSSLFGSRAKLIATAVNTNSSIVQTYIFLTPVPLNFVAVALDTWAGQLLFLLLLRLHSLKISERKQIRCTFHNPVRNISDNSSDLLSSTRTVVI